MIQDMVLFGGASFIVLLIVMWLVFRCWQGVVGTMLVVMAALCVTYGSMAALGVAVTMPLSAVMVFLTALGMQYSTYIGFAHRQQVHKEREYNRPLPRDHRFVLSEALRDVRGSIGLSAVTTAIGFGSMYMNRVPDLRTMGLFLVIGLLTTSLGVMTIHPAIITLFPYEVPEHTRDHHRLQSMIDRIGRLATSRPKLMLAIAGGMFSLGVFGVFHLDTNTDAMHYFKKSSEIRKAEDFVRARMAGTTYLQAVVFADKLDTFKDPANLAKLEAIQRYAETLPHVTKTVSHADHIKLMNRALRSGTNADFKLPDNQAAVEQYLLLHNEPDDFRLWVDSDYQNASITVRMDTMSSTVQRETEDKVETFMRQQFPAAKVNLVGTNLLTHRAFDEMATSMLKSLGLATLLIWLVMVIGLGSLKLGTLSLVPNLAPSVIVYALLPLMGHPLDPPTAVTGAVALGITSDDTIHFFKTWLARRRRAGSDPVTSVTSTLAEIGKPMVLSSVVVAVGFSIMLVSRYGTLVWTGIMMCIVTGTAVVWELVCTPSMLRLLGGKVKPAKPEDMSKMGDFRKISADDKRSSFADYADAEIANMTTADFLALAGKTVIRHGGSNGTRRLLVEVDIKPNSRILELGAGVGATAFDLVAADPTVHVTGVDLSAFMIDKSRARAEQQAEVERKRGALRRGVKSPYERRRPESEGGLPDERRRADRRAEPRRGLNERIAFVHTTNPNVLPFDDNTFDLVIVESVAMYNDTEKFFREILRVLKPGGRLGLHDWCWTEKPPADLEVMTCVIACGCNPGDVKFFTQADWEASLKRQGFEIGFAEQYPFTFFSWSGMKDDEGTWKLLKMFGRVLTRKATAKRMMKMMAFLARHEGRFGYTVTIAHKPLATTTRPAVVASAFEVAGSHISLKTDAS
jgi:predicted RND superfamily exporter protein/SAM-dependent methyltransferase